MVHFDDGRCSGAKQEKRHNVIRGKTSFSHKEIGPHYIRNIYGCVRECIRENTQAHFFTNHSLQCESVVNFRQKGNKHAPELDY